MHVHFVCHLYILNSTASHTDYTYKLFSRCVKKSLYLGCIKWKWPSHILCDPVEFKRCVASMVPKILREHSCLFPTHHSYYCSGDSNPFPTGLCAEGCYCPGSASSSCQIPNVPGSFSGLGQAAATPCFEGTFQQVCRDDDVLKFAWFWSKPCQPHTANGLTCDVVIVFLR